MTDPSFRKAVETLVAKIPRGRLMSYGQIAAVLDAPRLSRAVGFVAHHGDAKLPWQRVVNRHGRMAPGFPGGMPAQAGMLREEGIAVDDEFHCDFERYRWEPPETAIPKVADVPQDA